MDDSKEDQRLEHHRDPKEFLDLEELKTTTGVLYWKLNPETYDTDGVLDKIRKDRGYSYKDVIECSEEKLPCYEEKLKIFFTEHLHTEEEIRYIIEGSGYFDVRNGKDDWIRIEVVRGDLLILPAGIYHRFTLDSNNFAKAMRLFIGEPVWTPHNRPADDMKERKQYLERLEAGFN